MSVGTDYTIGLVGAGEIAKSALGFLLEDLPGATFIVFDPRPGTLAAVSRLDPERIVVKQDSVSAWSLDLLRGLDVVLNTAGPFFTDSAGQVAQACIQAGVGYVDVCDDAEGVVKILELDSSAKAAGVAVTSGAGFSPGMSNIWAKRVTELVPEVDGLDLAWLVRDPDPGGLAALHHLLHMAVAPCPQLVDGRLTTSLGFVPETRRTLDFGELLGEAEVFNAPHPEPLTLPAALPQLKSVLCSGGLVPAWANEFFSSAARLGFAGQPSDAEADAVRVLWQLLRDRFERSSRGADGFCGLRVAGSVGDEIAMTVELMDDAPMARATGLGAAAVVAEHLTRDLSAGVAGPERLDAEDALAAVARMASRRGAFASGPVVRMR